jgi:hypothetical protein
MPRTSPDPRTRALRHEHIHIAAIHTQDLAAIQAYFAQCDVESGNQALLATAEAFHFVTHVVQEAPANGQRLGRGRDLADLMYGHTDTDTLQKLLRHHQRPPLLALGSFRENLGTIRDRFGLPRKTTKAMFFSWEHLLFAGLHDTTEQAKHVRDYLLSREQRGRVAEQVEQETGFTPRQLSDQEALARNPARKAIHDLALATARIAILAREVEVV